MSTPKLCGWDPLKILGQGVQATVWEIPGKLALKKIEDFKTPNNLIELDILSRVNHPNVIKAKQISLEENSVCLIMELGNISLKNYILNVDLSDQNKLDLSLSLMKGVEYLHVNYILHLDLHWNNVLLFKEGEEIFPKIIDFGMARNFTKENNKVIINGIPNPLFCPPELLFQKLQGAKSFVVGKETDNWAIINLISVIYQKRYLFGLGEEDEDLSLIVFYQMNEANLLNWNQEDLLSRIKTSFGNGLVLEQWEGYQVLDGNINQTGKNIISYFLELIPEERQTFEPFIQELEKDWIPQIINYNDEIKDENPLEDFILNLFPSLSYEVISEAISILERVNINGDPEEWAIVCCGLAAALLMGTWTKHIVEFLNNSDIDVDGITKDILTQLNFNLFRPD